MNLLLIDPHEVDPQGRVVLHDRRARHLRQVLKVAPGDTVRVGQVRGPSGQAEVVAVEEAEVRLQVAWEREPPAPPKVDLILAVPRPKALRRILQSVASLGVGRLDLVNAWRVEKSYFDSPRMTPEAIEAELRLGCEQGHHTWVPEARVHPLLMPFLEALPPPGNAVRVLLDPRAEAPLEAVLPPGAGERVVLAVGPEGGWIDQERASLAERGFRSAHLGMGVLTTGGAVTAALAQVALLRRLLRDPVGTGPL